MARGTTLIRLLDKLRAAARLSKLPAHNVQVRDSHVDLLQTIQERLWDDFDWPHLRVERQIPVQAGERYYDTPADMHIDNIEKIEIFYGARWLELKPGIGGPELSTYNSDLDQRSWPVRKWQIHEGEDVEIWPIADQNADDATREGYIKFTGIRDLKPLVADNDRADLDDNMLVLYAAGEILAASGAKDAKLKLDQANAIYRRLRSGLTPKVKTKLFGIGETPRPSRMFVTNYKPAGS
jgi:hypothetical protein